MSKAFFHKPQHKLLSRLGSQQVDMHFHTRHSDSHVSVSKALDKAKKKGIGLAITDHNEIEGAMKAVDNDKGVLVIPGIEVSCYEGPHILLYFYETEELRAFFEGFLRDKRNGNPYMATKARVEEVLEEASKYNCLKFAAHPYGYMTANSGLMKAIKKEYVHVDVLNKLDGFEAICGAMNRYLNKKAAMYAEKHNFMVTGGSDGHCLFQQGRVVTLAKGKTRQAFLNSIKKKESIALGKEPRAVTKLLPATSTIGNHSPYILPTVKLQSVLMYERAKHFKGKVINKCRNGKVISKKVLSFKFRKHKDFK